MPNGGSGIIEKYFLQMKAAVKKKGNISRYRIFSINGDNKTKLMSKITIISKLQLLFSQSRYLNHSGAYLGLVTHLCWNPFLRKYLTAKSRYYFPGRATSQMFSRALNAPPSIDEKAFRLAQFFSSKTTVRISKWR